MITNRRSSPLDAARPQGPFKLAAVLATLRRYGRSVLRGRRASKAQRPARRTRYAGDGVAEVPLEPSQGDVMAARWRTAAASYPRSTLTAPDPPVTRGYQAITAFRLFEEPHWVVPNVFRDDANP